MERFKENVDAWIKQINSEFSELEHYPAVAKQNTENIQFNYELIKELRAEIDDLKNELKALTMLQIAHLKKRV